MHKRVGLLAALLMLVLASEGLAQSPPPSATPSSPADLVSAEPLRIGDFTVEWVPMSGFTDGPEWDDLLASVGKEPEDIQHVGSAVFLPGNDGMPERVLPAFSVRAFRIDGVPARAITEAVYRAWLGLPSDVDLEDTLFPAEWFDLDGREVYASNALTMPVEWGPLPDDWNPEWGAYLYPVGEVLYDVYIPEDPVASPPLADILDALR